MSKTIVLVGQTCAGKTELAKVLEKNFGYRRIVTYTTRPPREGEECGVDYYFIKDDEAFEDLVRDEYFAEWTEYYATFGHCYYGSAVKDYVDGNNVIVLNPEGARQVKAAMGDKVFIVYLDVPEYTLLTRAKNRGDDMAEVQRRLLEDEARLYVPFRKDKVFDLCIYGNISTTDAVGIILSKLNSAE